MIQKKKVLLSLYYRVVHDARSLGLFGRNHFVGKSMEKSVWKTKVDWKALPYGGDSYLW